MVDMRDDGKLRMLGIGSVVMGREIDEQAQMSNKKSGVWAPLRHFDAV